MKVRCLNAEGFKSVLREGNIYEGELKFNNTFNENRWEIRGIRKVDGVAFKKWRFKEVKELTFKEVIASIKDGESYRAIYKKGLGNCPTITRNQNSIEIDFPLKTDCYLFTRDMLFELVRKNYTFEEAFKAFEEGKEMESCEGWKFKKKGDKVIVTNHSGARFEESSANALFSLKEMKGDWYINE